MARYVVTAGSGDTYRIERIHLDRDQAYRFMRDYNGIAPLSLLRSRNCRRVAASGL